MEFRFQWEQEAGGCGHKEKEAGNMLSHAMRPLVNFSVFWPGRQNVMQRNVELSRYPIAHRPSARRSFFTDSMQIESLTYFLHDMVISRFRLVRDSVSSPQTFTRVCLSPPVIS